MFFKSYTSLKFKTVCSKISTFFWNEQKKILRTRSYMVQPGPNQKMQAKQLFRSAPPPPPFPQSAPFFPSPERTQPRSLPCFSGSVRREHITYYGRRRRRVCSTVVVVEYDSHAGKEERFTQGKKA